MIKMEVVWNVIKFVAILFASFELFSIITNKNKKMSIAGTIVLAFSGCILWNLNKIDAIVLGEVITVLIHKIINETKIKKMIPMSILTVVCSVAYVYTFRPFAISFGYVFFALILWIIVQNRKNLKDNKSKIITLSITIFISIIGAICAELFFANPYGDYIEKNTTAGFSGLFTYLYTPLLAFNNMDDPSIWAGIISIFPIPMCVALYYLYKKDEHIEFLMPMVFITVIETIYCISGFPEIIAKVTMLSEASPIRVVPAVQFANILIMFYFLENVKEQLFNIRNALRITILTICILVFIKYPVQFSAKVYLYLFAAELSLLVFMFFNYADEKYKKVFLVLLCLVSLIGGVPAIFLA